MASGSLPLKTYHRAQSLGAGTFGSVVTVYDEDGGEFALKLFLPDDEEEDDHPSPMEIGAMREISILRLLRGDNAHANIVEIADVQTEFADDEDAVGAGTGGCLGMAMPLFRMGSLGDNLTKLSSKRDKVQVVHGILKAVAFLHNNAIIHRDIKADNVLLDESFRPVLIDFSLAKFVDPALLYQNQDYFSPGMGVTGPTHTCEVGTPTYRAPEVLERKPYGLPSDMWSVGVICVEILRGHCLETEKDKGAIKMIQEILKELPENQPFPDLIRGLLRSDPAKRLTAKQALEANLFSKFNLEQPGQETFRLLDLRASVPLDDDTSVDENDPPSRDKRVPKNTPKKKKYNPKLQNRYKLIQKICRHMEWDNPLTAQAALTYSIQMSQLDDVDNLNESQALLDCIVLAHRVFERYIADLRDLEEGDHGKYFQNWTLEQYLDNESTIFMMLDFCLFPRKLHFADL